MASLEDDDALFQDIYGEDAEEQETGTEPVQESKEEKSEETNKEEVASVPGLTNTEKPEVTEEEPKVADTNDDVYDPGSTAPETLEPPAPQPAGGFTSATIGKELLNKSEYFNRDQGKMFVGGLNWETTEEGMRAYFSQFGEVIDLNIMRDNATGRSRGFGFLTFSSGEAVDKVVAQQHVLDGKVIDPKRAIPKEEQERTGKIFVGGIAPNVTEKEFDEFFSQYGNVIDAQLMIDKDSGRSRGFGFVTYDLAEAVEAVCRNKFIEMNGKRMEVKKAEPRGQQRKNRYNNGGFNNYNNYNNYNNNYPNRGYPQQQQAQPQIDPQALQQYWQYWMQMQNQQGGMQPQQPGMPPADGQQPQMGGYAPASAGNEGEGAPLTLHSAEEDQGYGARGRGGFRGGRGRGGYGRGRDRRGAGYHPYAR